MVLWTAIFIAPVISHLIHFGNTDRVFLWEEMGEIWIQVAAFLLAFLLHNYMLAPLIVYKQKRLQYFSAIAVLIGCFIVYQCSTRPSLQDGKPKHEMAEQHRPMGAPHTFDEGAPHTFDEEEPPLRFDENERPPKFDKRPPLHKPDKHPPIIIGEHDIIATIILILMLGMNVGVKLYFKQRRDQQRLALLEKENLEQQLEYLKYQINPYFLMNTLNNIHALVDIDPERAKEAIVVLSQIMRFVLYDGARQVVPLNKELSFLKDYITLMRMRYTDKVDIQADIPSAPTDCEVPPLLLITFVENAFKHGISYQQQSFIDIKADIRQNRLHFTCRNSKAPKGNDQPGGVGLQNVKRRLRLIYGENYLLDIKDETSSYNITLEIPLYKENESSKA